jgi:hypothetical protein
MNKIINNSIFAAPVLLLCVIVSARGQNAVNDNSSPSPRNQPAAAFDAARGKFVVFGGIAQDGKPWVIVRPAGLINKPALGKYRVGTEKTITAGRILQGDAAAFMFEQATGNQFLFQTPAIAY